MAEFTVAVNGEGVDVAIHARAFHRHVDGPTQWIHAMAAEEKI